MGGRAWSQEELIRLEELTEKYPLATVARILNRSENAVFLKKAADRYRRIHGEHRHADQEHPLADPGS